MTSDSTQSERRWCEACRDHFDGSHYDEHGNHRRGSEFGPTGAAMEMYDMLTSEREMLRRALAEHENDEQVAARYAKWKAERSR